MSGRTSRRYGMPFRGLVNSVERHEVPTDAITEDSYGFLVKPGAAEGVGKLVRRRGAAVYGSNTGVLEMAVASATMRGLEAFELPSPSLATGYPELAVLFADESKRYGQLWLRDGSTDYTLGEEFGSTHYPNAASTVGNYKMPAMPYDGNGATGYTRGAFEENRRRLCAGTRKRQGVRSWDYGGGFHATPWKWNRAYNKASGSGSENLRFNPMGHTPPLWAPTFPAASYPTRSTTVGPWTEGDKFFCSVLFEWEDGSYSKPFLPQDIGTTLTAGLGLVTVDDDADGTVEYFTFIPWRNIAIGPPGVVARILLRTPKVSKTSIAAGSWPNIKDLRIVTRIPNNTQTAYDDFQGNDSALVADTTVMRYDHKWPDRAKYAWAFDQRLALGYLRPNPCGIVIAPGGLVTAYDVNGNDESTALHSATALTLRVTTTNLELKAGAYAAAVPGKTSIALSASKSLAQLVDEINATVVGGGGKQWVAQLVPGADGNAPSDQLAPTVQSVTNCTGTGTTLATTTTNGFVDVAEGMKVSGAGITAGTYVITKNSNTSLVLSVASTSAAATLQFYVDTGDDAIFTDGELGNIRCFGGALAQPLALKQSLLDTYETAKRDFIMTAGGPTHAPFAANNFYTALGNRRSAESDAGILMGGAPLRNGCIVFFSNRIGWFVNERSGGSGEDADYRLRWIEFGRGCISPYSIVYGNGWVGCLTQDGFWVFDGEATAIISRDIYDRHPDGTDTGELSYEIGQCAGVAASDGTDYQCFAHYRDGRLWLKYRKSAGVYAVLCYDCTPSVEASGLGQITRDGKPYGWSSRLFYNWRAASTTSLAGCIGSCRRSTGIRLYSTDDTNDKTNCGLVFEIETPGAYVEGADYVKSLAYFVTDLVGTLRKKSAVRLTALLRLEGNAGDASLLLYRNQVRGTPHTLALTPTAASKIFSRQPIELPVAAKGSCESLEFALSAATNSVSLGDLEFSGMECEVEMLDSFN